jgi:molecular chaperone HscB
MTTDPFATLGLPPRYDVDPQDIERRWRDLSRVLHPDRYAQASATERRLSLDKAVVVNVAYRTLGDPLARAEALLGLGGHDKAQAECARDDSAFLMEMMELREALADARSGDDGAAVTRLGQDVARRRADAERELTEAFDAADLARAARTLGRLRYYRRMLDDVASAEDAP